MSQTGIDLRGAYVLVSHHLAHGFQRGSLRKSDKGSEIMPCGMVGKPTFYAAELVQFRHVVGQGGTARHIKKFVTFPFTHVFFQDTPWNIKEKYVTLTFCLLTFEPYLKISLIVRVQIRNIQIAHIRICDASERAKDKQVADKTQELFPDRRVHQPLQFVRCQMAVLPQRLFWRERSERIVLDCTLCHCCPCHRFQHDDVVLYGYA